MPAAKFDLIDYDENKKFSLKQGEDYALRLRFFQSVGVPYNFTSVTGFSQLRRDYADPEPAASFVVEFDADRTNGWVTLKMTGAVLALLTAGRYVWDLFFILSDDSPWSPVEGHAVVRPRASTP